jgi:hypothetical protein
MCSLTEHICSVIMTITDLYIDSEVELAFLSFMKVVQNNGE